MYSYRHYMYMYTLYAHYIEKPTKRGVSQHTHSETCLEKILHFLTLIHILHCSTLFTSEEVCETRQLNPSFAEAVQLQYQHQYKYKYQQQCSSLRAPSQLITLINRITLSSSLLTPVQPLYTHENAHLCF